MADANPTRKPATLAKIAGIVQRDGSTIGELLYILASRGDVVIIDGIVRAAQR